MSEAPRARDDLVFRPLGREWVLYDPESGKLHLLNAAAAVVWGLLDGEHDTDALARALAETLSDPPDRDAVVADVEEALRTFEEEGLLA